MKTKITLLITGVLIASGSFAQERTVTCTNTEYQSPGGILSTENTVLWLDANKISQANGTTVNYWYDVNQANRYVKQASTSKRPTLMHNAINGKKSLVFDGVNDIMTSPAITDLMSNNAFSWITVSLPTGGPQLGHVISGNHGTTSITNHLWKTFTGASGSYQSGGRNSNGTNVWSNIGAGSGTVRVVTTAWDIASDLQITDMNVVGGGVVAGATMNPAANKWLTIGGRSDFETQFFRGQIAEVAVFNKFLSRTEKEIAVVALLAKYGHSNAAIYYPGYAIGSNEVGGVGYLTGIASTPDDAAVPTAFAGMVGFEINGAPNAESVLHWGHNNGALTTSNYLNGKKLNRTWYCNGIGSITSTITITFDVSSFTSTDYVLLVNGSTEYPMTYDSNCDIATVTLNENQIKGSTFTLANPNGVLLVAPIMEFEGDELISEEEIEIEASAMKIYDENNMNIEMKLYPNPSSGDFTIENVVEGASVEIYNTMGQLVMQSSVEIGKNKYDFSNLNNGIYLIHLKDINQETINISQFMLAK